MSRNFEIGIKAGLVVGLISFGTSLVIWILNVLVMWPSQFAPVASELGMSQLQYEITFAFFFLIEFLLSHALVLILGAVLGVIFVLLSELFIFGHKSYRIRGLVFGVVPLAVQLILFINGQAALPFWITFFEWYRWISK